MTVTEQLERLEDRLAALEFELALLRASVEERLRTRQIVVVDESGSERIVLDARHGTGSVLVHLSGAAGATTGVEIYASEPEIGPPEIGVCVIREGNVVSRWTAG